MSALERPVVRSVKTSGRSMRALRVVSSIASMVLFATFAAAQFRGAADRSVDAHMARDDSFDGRFHYCRAVYRINPRGEGGSWLTDYPLADIDLSVRVSELTKIRVSFDAAGQPNHLIVPLTGGELYRCPVILMQEVGRLLFSDEDAERMRSYLLKGGFLWVDDFWGSYAWDVWEREIRKVFPADRYAIVDVPSDHPIFHTMFDLDGVPQIPGIGTFLAGRTSERGADSAEVHARAIADAHGRVMVFMTHNTDVSDSWEREAEDPTYFQRFSVDGYRVAVNVLLYAMTH
jgi:hypothetical protein